MVWRDLGFVGAILGGVATLGAGLLRPRDVEPPRAVESPLRASGDVREIVDRIDSVLHRQWRAEGLTPARPAPELAVLRRLALALTGSVPSLEEIRRFEGRPRGARLEMYLDDLLHDRRTSDYLAERLARALVGTEDGPFLLFRRRRFRTWLSDAILENRPYDAVVRDLIAEDGLWTDHPATNFVTVTRDEETERPDPERLAARVSRAFLGARIDCARCHDHPFASWKQEDFRGLAAFFGGVRANLRGIRDEETTYRPVDRATNEPVKDPIEPRVPFAPELLPETGEARDRLASWVVDPRNPSLARATVNRFWALLFGRPVVEPVDDLPIGGELPEALTLLAADFSAHGYDLHRLIRTIAATEAFRLDSALDESAGSPIDHEVAWAVFPMTRLRPEQVAGSIFQAASLKTLDAETFWFARLAAFNGRNDFVRRYGDAGEDEFDPRGGTIPQRLLLLNGDLVRDKTKGELWNAATRIAMLAPDDPTAVEVAYLTVLTRLPSPEERTHFSARIDDTKGDTRKERLADLCWTLLNATEFSWNH